jgi:hypothetical protein
VKNIFSGINFLPINKTAGLVVSSGFEFEPIKTFENVYKDIPEIIPFESDKIGFKFGRLTVIGKHHGKKWVCRCICGNYLLCGGKRISNAKNNISLHERSMCNECDYLIYIKRGREEITPISKYNRKLKRLRRDK